MGEVDPVPGGGDSDLAVRLAGAYLDLRRGIGLIGILLPFVLLVGNSAVVLDVVIRPSVSSYYYTNMRDVFVGSLCAIGVFLLAYRYETVDTWASSIAGTAAICVALFPTSAARTPKPGGVGIIHLVAAAVFFLTLAFFCLFLFTRSSQPTTQQTPRKRLRNKVYRACGGTILACLVIAATSTFLPVAVRNVVHPLYWSEFVAIVAFGLAWTTKGDAIGPLRDHRAEVVAV